MSEVPEDLTPEQRQANRERNYAKIAEVWADKATATFELEELQRLTAPAPEQLRRIAELVEYLSGKGKALQHWERAAEAGDQDAKDYLSAWNEDVSDVDPLLAMLRRALIRRDGE